MGRTGIGSRNDSGAQKRKRKAEEEKLKQSMQGAIFKHFHPENNANERTPEAESMSFSTEVASPSVEVATSHAEVATPHAEVATPHAEVATPHAEVATPHAGVATPPVEVATTPIKDATPSEEVITPPVEVTTLPAEITTPPVKVTTPDEKSNLDSQNQKKDEYTDLKDIGKWPETLSPNLKKFLAEKGPQREKDFSFPQDSRQRHFSASFYKRRMPNGEIVERRWLVYSKSIDAVFCFCCKLFSAKENRFSGMQGHNNWQNLSSKLLEHESSSNHKLCHSKWIELENRISNLQTIDSLNEKDYQKEKKHWRNVLERLLSITQFLAERNLPFRGSEEKFNNPRNGNFLGLIELISNYDPILQEHIRRIENKEVSDHYLSSRIQNEFINLIGEKVLSTLIEKIKKAKYYSVILDCTPDISHQEQMTLIIRYVEIKSEGKININESFLGFLNVEETTGQYLGETFLRKLSELGLDIQDCRGQGYDNGANMRGSKKGVQTRILEINQRALFVPCGCHSWNLVLSDMAKSSNYAITFFGIIQQIYVLFSSSTQRWHVFKKHVKNLTLKPLCETRWESRINSVKAVRYQIGEIYDALIEISENSKDPKYRSEAEALAKEIKCYKFLVSICFWYDILTQFNFLNTIFQNRSIVIHTALEQINHASKFLSEYRENGFEKIKAAAKTLASELEIEENLMMFPKPGSRRRKKMKKLFSYEGDSEETEDPEQNFKINFFYSILDQALMSVKERFQQMKNFEEKFGFLFEIFETTNDDIILKSCKNLENHLGDLSGFELFTEIKTLSATVKSLESPLETLEYICKNKFQDIFPNLMIALRTVLTIPVTVASAERSFSKLKIIKSYMRSTMSNDRLTSLALISVESSTASQIDYSEVIDDFASKKSRKILL